ncbi:hypothetical protein K8T06_04885 [bacterium]|nr:hypothetical protein [bacterium]
MSNKQTTFLGPFLITFTGAIVLGLCILYFGFYQNRIEAFKNYVAEIQTKPTPEINLSFTVDDSGVTRGKSLPEPDVSEKSVKKTEEKSAQNSDNSSISKTGKSRKPNLAKPVGRRSKKRSKSRKSRLETGRTSSQEESTVTRGPAFPSSRSKPRDAEFDTHDEKDYESSENDRDIPDINDPEMDDNPLIRALREASQRQQDNPRPADDNKPTNPFEAILNTRN